MSPYLEKLGTLIPTFAACKTLKQSVDKKVKGNETIS